MQGKGRVMVDGNAESVEEGVAVIFPLGLIHMLKNMGTKEMKVICFFSPTSDVSAYKTYVDIGFPEE